MNVFSLLDSLYLSDRLIGNGFAIISAINLKISIFIKTTVLRTKHQTQLIIRSMQLYLPWLMLIRPADLFLSCVLTAKCHHRSSVLSYLLHCRFKGECIIDASPEVCFRHCYPKPESTRPKWDSTIKTLAVIEMLQETQRPVSCSNHKHITFNEMTSPTKLHNCN